jgi:hypothetical protein
VVAFIRLNGLRVIASQATTLQAPSKRACLPDQIHLLPKASGSDAFRASDGDVQRLSAADRIGKAARPCGEFPFGFQVNCRPSH